MDSADNKMERNVLFARVNHLGRNDEETMLNTPL